MPTALRIPVGNDVTITVFEWEGDGPPILLVHATGYHARCWDKVIARLPNRKVFAVDLRGHGRSDKPKPPHPWNVFGEDLVALLDKRDLHGIIGVGHSMGGHSLVTAAGHAPDRFAGIILLDPVIRSPEEYALMPPRLPMDHPTFKRRNFWRDADEMFERFKNKSPFNVWRPEVLRDYCDYGLLPNPDGDGFVLACPPDQEASIYTTGAAFGIFDAIDRITCPVKVIRARNRTANDLPFSFLPSVTWPGLAGRFTHGTDEQWPEATHFIPMETPDRVAAEVEAMVARVATS